MNSANNSLSWLLKYYNTIYYDVFFYYDPSLCKLICLCDSLLDSEIHIIIGC